MHPPVRIFGKYLLDREIARGGMSRVFLARLRGLGGFEKRLVVKQVLPELARDPRFVSMFVQEAKTLVQMSHPHIAPVYELGVVDGVYFLAMEYVEGATLAEILRDGPLAPGLAAHLGAEVSDALHYAHERFDIVHRDVTPRNVIVDSGGHSRLLDFGIAAPAEDRDATELFGTPGYLSPEHFGGAPLGPPSDVFSLGAVLFEALTGRRAFPGRTAGETREALSGEGPAFEEADRVPPGLAAVVRRALFRDQEERWGSAHELGRGLRAWLASHAPEGVAPELGMRARRAERERDPLPWAVDNEEAPASLRPEVKTLATSRLLEDILESDIPAPMLDPSTVAIEERLGAPATTPSTAVVARPRQLQLLQGGASGGAEPAPEELAPGRARTLEEARTGRTDRAHGAGSDAPRRPTDSRAAQARRAAVIAGVVALGATAWTLWPVAPGATSSSDPDRTTAASPPSARLDPGRADDAGAERRGEDASGSDRISAEGEVRSRVPTEREGRDGESGGSLVATARASSGSDPRSERSNRRRPERAEPPGRATLTVNATPWADVRLDGVALGRTPLRRAPLRAGRHTIELECPPLGRHVRTSFEAEPDAALEAFVDLNASDPSLQIR